MLDDRLDVRPEVASALADGRAVVALESTLISHGLPYPANLEVAVASEAAVRSSGAVPATIAIRDGRLLVGLDRASSRRSPPPRRAPFGRQLGRRSPWRSRPVVGRRPPSRRR
jgi:pseudouridine-5'-phosphate glycosidase